MRKKMKPKLIFAVLAVMLALVGVVSAQQVSVCVDGTILQSITLTSTGTATGLTLPIGETVTDTVSLHRISNVPVKYTIVDAMGNAKVPAMAGHMTMFYTSGSTYSDILRLGAKTAFSVGANPYVTTSQTPGTLVASLPAGDVTETLHIKNTVGVTDPVPAAGSIYRLTVNIDAVAA